MGGGPSSEHEISLRTAEMVAKHLDAKKYKPFLVTINKMGKWGMPVNDLKNSADLAFIAMHGEYGEDGQVQKLLDAHGIPYTGSGASASALGMDKLKASQVFRSHGLRTPEFFFFTAKGYKKSPNKILKEIAESFDLPVVVKPSDRGSSVGVNIARTNENLAGAIKNAVAVSKNILAEEFVSGTELTCGILDDGKFNLTPLLPTEIVPKAGEFFDYTSKYKESGADEVTPARIPEEILKECQNVAFRAHVAVGCSGFSRTDMIWNKDRGLYVLEINTIPGLTAQSLLPKAAAASGILFPKLLDRIIESALIKES